MEKDKGLPADRPVIRITFNNLNKPYDRNKVGWEFNSKPGIVLPAHRRSGLEPEETVRPKVNADAGATHRRSRFESVESRDFDMEAYYRKWKWGSLMAKVLEIDPEIIKKVDAESKTKPKPLQEGYVSKRRNVSRDGNRHRSHSSRQFVCIQCCKSYPSDIFQTHIKECKGARAHKF